MLAMPTSAPLPRACIAATNGAKRVDEPDDVRVEDRAERRQVFRVLGQRAPRDSGVGDDDVGQRRSAR